MKSCVRTRFELAVCDERKGCASSFISLLSNRTLCISEWLGFNVPINKLWVVFLRLVLPVNHLHWQPNTEQPKSAKNAIFLALVAFTVTLRANTCSIFSIRLLVATREKYSESIRPLAAENFCLYEKEVRNTTKIERPFKAVSSAGALEKKLGYPVSHIPPDYSKPNPICQITTWIRSGSLSKVTRVFLVSTDPAYKRPQLFEVILFTDRQTDCQHSIPPSTLSVFGFYSTGRIFFNEITTV